MTLPCWTAAGLRGLATWALAAAIALSSGPVQAAGPLAPDDDTADLFTGDWDVGVGVAGSNDSFAFPIEPATGLPFDRWVSATSELRLRLRVPRLRPLPKSARVLVGATLGHAIITPRSVHIADVDELDGDRPYSGVLVGGLTLDVVLAGAPLALAATSGAATSHLRVAVDGGVVGPWSQAGLIQHRAHWSYLLLEGKELPPVVGWGTIETAPGLTAQLSVSADTSLVAVALDLPTTALLGSAPALHLRAVGRVDAGTTLVAGDVGLVLLTGLMADARRPAPADFLPVAAFVFARADARAVGWNRSIDGRLIDGQVVARSAPLVGEVAAGLVLSRLGRRSLARARLRTNEVASLPTTGATGQLIWCFSGTVLL